MGTLNANRPAVGRAADDCPERTAFLDLKATARGIVRSMLEPATTAAERPCMICGGEIPADGSREVCSEPCRNERNRRRVRAYLARLKGAA